MIFAVKRLRPVAAVALVAALMAVTLICPQILKAFAEDNSEICLPIVMYHQLTEKSSAAGKYVLMLEQFEKDLIYLKENGYSSITLAQLFDYSEGKGSMPEKPVMITFDDGCETVYTYALPLLEKYGFTAVCFIIGSVTDKYSGINDQILIGMKLRIFTEEA